MKNKTKDSHSKKRIDIIIPIVLLLIIILRFVFYYFKTDGYSGLSLRLPILVIGFILFAFATSGCFAAWVYEDCKERSDDGVLWSLIVFLMPPFIGLLIYFLRRSEIKQTCLSCGQKISLHANYCENCGSHVNFKEVRMMKKKTHHMKYIITGMFCMVSMFVCLTGFIVSAASGDFINRDISSDAKVWNTGFIQMSMETHINDIWKFRFNKASDGYVRENEFYIEDVSTQKLYADISCETVPNDATLTLWIVQGDSVKSLDVTNLEQTLICELKDFTNGEIRVRLEIHGVEDVTSEIYIK